MAGITAFLGLDDSRFAAGLNAAKIKAAAFGKSIGGVLQPGKLGAQLAGAFTVGSIGLAAKATIDYAGDIQDLAEKLGITAEAAQQFDYAFKQSGSTLEQNQSIFYRLAENIDAANKGSDEMAKKFARLNVTASDLKSKRIDQVFSQIGREIKSGQITPQRYADLIDLMGKSATNVIPAMKAGFSELADEAKRLGLVMNSETIASLANTGDALDRIAFKGRSAFGEFIVGATQIGGLLLNVQKIINQMTPGVKRLTDGIASIASFVGAKTATVKLPGDPETTRSSMSAAESEARAAEESAERIQQAADLEKKNAAAAQKLAFDRLSNEEKINLLMADRITMMRELNNINTRDPLYRAQLAAGVLQADAALLGLQKTKPPQTIKPDLNSLQQIGAFTSQRVVTTNPEKIAERQLDTLRRIESNTRKTGGNTITFPP